MYKVFANLYNFPSGLTIACLENTLMIQNMLPEATLPISIHSNIGDFHGNIQKLQYAGQEESILCINIDSQGVPIDGAIELDVAGLGIMNDTPILMLDVPGL